MTLDELARIALEKYYAEPYDAHDVLYSEVHEDMKIAVLAVLDEVRKAVPDRQPIDPLVRGNEMWSSGWDDYRESMLRRLDEMAK